MEHVEHERTIQVYSNYGLEQSELSTPLALPENSTDSLLTDRLWESFVVDFALDQNQAEAMRPLVEADGEFITFREIMYSLERAGVAQSPRTVTRALEKLRSKGLHIRTDRVERSTFYALDQDMLSAQRTIVDTRRSQEVEIRTLLDDGVQDFFLQRIAMSQADEVTQQYLRTILRGLRHDAGWPQRLDVLVMDVTSQRSPSALLNTLKQILPDGVLASNDSNHLRTYWYDYQALTSVHQLMLRQGSTTDMEAIEDRYSGVRYRHGIRSVLAGYVLAHLESEEGVTTRQKLVAALHQDGLYKRRHLLVNAFRALSRHGLVEVVPTDESVYGSVTLSPEFDVDTYTPYRVISEQAKHRSEQVLEELADTTVDSYMPNIKTTTPEKEWLRDSRFSHQEQALREGLEFVVPSDDPTILHDLFSIMKTHNGRVSLHDLDLYGFNGRTLLDYLKQSRTVQGQPVFIVNEDFISIAPALRSSRHTVVFTQK